MEALNAAAVLPPISVLCKNSSSSPFLPISPPKTSISARFGTNPPTVRECFSRGFHGGLVLLSSVFNAELARALTYEEALQQSMTSSDSVGVGGLDDLISFGVDNPGIVVGGVAALALPLLLSQFLKKPKPWGVESARSAYEKLGADANAQLLDIRAAAELKGVGSPDVKGLGKKSVSVVYKGDDKPGFLKKLGLKFKDPGNTTLFVLDKFDGNSELVAELVTINGFKAAYAIKDGAEGPRGWVKSGLPWIEPRKGFSLDLSNLTDAFSGAVGDGFDGLSVAFAVAAATGLGLLAYLQDSFHCWYHTLIKHSLLWRELLKLHSTIAMAPAVEAILKAQRAEGPATVLAIGTATPSNCVLQSEYPDFYFRITKSEHMTELKEKFQRMCDKSMITKRYMHLTEDILKENPKMCEYMAPSIDARQDMVVVEVPKLGKEAAVKAIKEWGQPKSKITHLIFCTTSGVDMPGADYQLTKLLGLRPSVKRFMMYQQGCFAGGTVLRLAKDLAENNRGARVLVVCSEITAVTFRGPSDTHLDSLVGQALFGDGAAAVIVGADPDTAVERPLFQLVSAAQTILPDSDGAIDGHLREVGLTFHLLKDVPGLISKNIEKSLVEAFKPIGISDWNSIFWIAHPGGPAILDQVELKLGLKEEKMRATRKVLSEYGNMSSACVLFIMDEMRKKSAEEGKLTSGEGLEWGVLFGFGPGLTVETVVLHSMATQ